MLLCRCLVDQFFKFKRKCILDCSKSAWRNSSSCQKSPRVLFFGTDNFSLPSLQKLHQSNFPVAVVTSFKSPSNCVRTFAESQELPVFRWPISAEHCAQYDLGVVVSFGHLIPARIINALPKGIINVHASLLPRWRGAAPIIYAIMNGDSTTGVTIMQIHPHHFDVGPILAQREMSIEREVLMPELHKNLSHLGADLLVDTIYNFEHRLRNMEPQNEALATYAPKITSRITDVAWSKQSASELYSTYRALYGFKYLTTTFLDRHVQILEVLKPGTSSEPVNLAPGSFCYHRGRKTLAIGCAQRTLLEVRQIRIEGKKPMSAQDFNNGFLKRAPSLKFQENKQAVSC